MRSALAQPGDPRGLLRHLILPAVVPALLPATLIAQAVAREVTLPRVRGSRRAWLGSLLPGRIGIEIVAKPGHGTDKNTDTRSSISVYPC